MCTKPQDTLACDLFELYGKLFLIVVDRYSKFGWMEPIVDHATEKTILAFLNIISKLGIPNKIWCNRDSNFYPEVFTFFSNLDIVLEFSNSYHHFLNPAERAVRTVKNIMKKWEDEKLGNSSWRIGLIEYLCALIFGQLPHLAEISNSCIYKGYHPFLCSSSRPSQSLINLLKGRKKRYFTMIDHFQIGQLLLKGKMSGIETMLRISGRKEPL